MSSLLKTLQNFEGSSLNICHFVNRTATNHQGIGSKLIGPYLLISLS